MKRSGKFYSRNEKETLLSLGLKPAPMSGAGWIVKEDGENEVVMVQLKSTDSSSYRLDLLDMKKLEYHADVSKKLPVFLIQFLKADKIYAVVDINSLDELGKAFKTGKVGKKIVIEDNEEMEVKRKAIKSSKKSREKFFKERGEKFGRK
nr:MAG TPA: hypothetical protein [Caudoviricetes sp.]